MNYVQFDQATMPENVEYITELIADYCYKGLSHFFFFFFFGGGNWYEFVPGSLLNL